MKMSTRESFFVMYDSVAGIDCVIGFLSRATSGC